MPSEIQAVYQGELCCKAMHLASGERIVTRASPDLGGKGEAFSPLDLLSTALGTCILTILGVVAARHDLDLSGTTVSVNPELVTGKGRRIEVLRTIVTFPAFVQLDEAMWSRLTAATSRCPVHQCLHPDIDAPISFRIGA